MHTKTQVHTSTDRQDFNYGQFAVIRRFKDFVWLSHRLEEEFPGIVMPALPVKMLVGKFDQTFVEVSHCMYEEGASLDQIDTPADNACVGYSGPQVLRVAHGI